MPTSVSRKQPKKPRKRAGRRQSETREDLRSLLDQRDRLYEAARRDPDSEAADLARTFLFTGMLAGQRGSGAGTSEVARLEQMVRDQKARLEEIGRTAQAAQNQKLSAKDLCRRIAEVVGLAAPSPAAFEQMVHAGEIQGEEQTCTTQSEFQTGIPPRNS